MVEKILLCITRVFAKVFPREGAYTPVVVGCQRLSLQSLLYESVIEVLMIVFKHCFFHPNVGWECFELV